MINGYTTVKEMAERWEITHRTVQVMCAEGKIEGVTKFGKAWAIPENAKKTTDNRMTSGEYKNWRKILKVIREENDIWSGKHYFHRKDRLMRKVKRQQISMSE